MTLTDLPWLRATAYRPHFGSVPYDWQYVVWVEGTNTAQLEVLTVEGQLWWVDEDADTSLP